MYHFEYVSKNERKEVKRELIEIINLVQNCVRNYFTFSFEFVGSEQLNLVTCDTKSNIGFDFDVNIEVNDDEENYSAKEIKQILINAFDFVIRNNNYGYDYCENSTRVFTIKFKDYGCSRILHSCDFAIIYNCGKGEQQYIRFNKKQNSYYWEYQPEGYYKLSQKIELIKEKGLWNDFRDQYLYRKNHNTDSNKKSHSLRAEVIHNFYQKIKFYK